MISMLTIPINLRTPGSYNETDSSAAAGGASNPKSLIVGQMTSAATVAASTPTKISNAGDAGGKFGVGSLIHRMAIATFRNDPLAEHWAIGISDDALATSAAGTIGLSGTATANGTIYAYVGGTLITTGVSSGDSASTIATALAAALSADTSLPVTATSSAGDVTVTAKNAGTLGNKIDIRVNYRNNDGEATPAGITVTLTQMSGGATDPSVAAAIVAMAEDAYYNIYWPYPDDTNLDTLKAEMDDSLTGRWGPLRQLYGHVWTAYEAASESAIDTHTTDRNDQHATIAGFVNSPTWEPEFGAAYGAACARSLRSDRAAPCQTIEVKGVLAPPRASQALQSERNTHLYNGAATWTQKGTTVYVERAITTYQDDAGGSPDASMLDVQTLKTLEGILLDMISMFTGKFPRTKLAADGFPLRPGQNIVTPSVIKGAILSMYNTWIRLGWVENVTDFATNLIVEKNASDPNRVDVLLPPDLVNQLRVLATKVQFRLDYQS